MRFYKIFIMSLPAVTLMTGGCGSDEKGELVTAEAATISGLTVTDITPSSFSLSATVNHAYNAVFESSGFCYSTSPNPTVKGTKVNAGIDASGRMSASVSSLSPSYTYYIRAYVNQYGRGVIYSDDKKIATVAGNENDELAGYVAPAYPDYYVDIAGWDNRSLWNLANVHDPSVMKADDGYYYMYQTDASYGNAHDAGGHFHARRSKDLVNWEYLGGTMKELPSWVMPKLNEIRNAMGLGNSTARSEQFGYWAPVARKVSNGLYRMYYSIVTPGLIDGEGTWGERAFIGMMETTDPASNVWEDKGYVITNVSDRNLDYHVKADDWANCYFRFNAIDPSYIITESGEHWLIYGSWHSGISAVKLDPSTGKPAERLGNPWGGPEDIAAYGTLIATRQTGNRWQGSEGPEIVWHDGYYYLFLAYDELSVAYNTRVVRSKNICGPYLGINGVNVTQGGDAYPIVTHPYKFSEDQGWVGISHCAVFDDGSGNWWYVSQGRMPANVNNNPYSNALMMGHLRSIRWTKDGWPLVMPERYGAVPKVAITESELIGKWEHIDLSYSYGQQKRPEEMILGADHKVASGEWKGETWSYNPTDEILTINGVDLYLQRECDWEANPRRHTIVYAGMTSATTFWGKKN